LRRLVAAVQPGVEDAEDAAVRVHKRQHKRQHRHSNKVEVEVEVVEVVVVEAKKLGCS
jgi:hypothetical protein